MNCLAIATNDCVVTGCTARADHPRRTHEAFAAHPLCSANTGHSSRPLIMSFTPAALWNQLESHWPTPACSDVLIAFSGGLDSTALLAAIVEESRERGVRVRAIHIDHQLQAASGKWSRHCIDFARTLNVECMAVQVAVDLNSKEGIESAARQARYDVLRKWLRPGEILLTAHHADDQLETIVL